MEDLSDIVDAKYLKEVSRNVAKFIVIASRLEKDQWHLSVQNEYGISSNWLEFFPSSQAAIETGVRAIEEEGVEPFICTEEFEYMFYENV